MGKLSKALEAFIDSIPDNKLTGFSEGSRNLYRDINFRLDMQGKTSDGKYNLQVQVNNGTAISTLKKVAPKTVAGPVLADGTDTESADDVRAALKDKMLL